MTTTEDKTNYLSILIPFSGFYESVHNHLIEDEVNSLFRDDYGNDETPDNFWNHIDTKKLYEDYAREYVSVFKHWLENHGLVIDSLTFDRLDSPQFYNFETDRIFCTISKPDVLKLAGLVLKAKLERVIKDRHTSRSGFASFYSNNVETWLEKPFTNWDHNELQTLLMAAMMQRDIEDIDDFDMMENSHCNGGITRVIEGAISERGWAIANAWHTANREKDAG